MSTDSIEQWNAYFWEPGSRVLRNNWGERDYAQLHDREFAETAKQQRAIGRGQVQLSRTYDADHLKAIHKALFRNVYEWAGEYRTIAMYRSTPGGFAEVAQIDTYLRDAQRLIEATPWATVDRDEFAAMAATVFAYCNHAHPFREGNGRAAKLFMEHIADRSQFRLDYTHVDPARWNEASMLSGPDRLQYEPQPATLVPVFYDLATARGQHAAEETSGT